MWTCPHCDGQTDDGFDICWTCRTPAGHATTDEVSRSRTLLTTTPTIETHTIIQYLWPVYGETVWGTSVFRDFDATLTDLAGGRSSSYEEVLQRGRMQAIQEMTSRAERIGANAVVGVDIKYETLGDSMFLICVSGMAVRVRAKDGSNNEED